MAEAGTLDGWLAPCCPGRQLLALCSSKQVAVIDPALFMTNELHMWTNPDRGERLKVIRSHFTADVEFH